MRTIEFRALATRAVQPRLRDLASCRKVSHISAHTFEQNKNGWPHVPTVTVDFTGKRTRIQLGNQVEVDPEDISVTFEDVKGADEAKQELKDVVRICTPRIQIKHCL
uniref:Uncharacterized protein n=1 Tax=Heliothis virescens TaxID=7102 RepID=A0A2A4J0X8_HELVI